MRSALYQTYGHCWIFKLTATIFPSLHVTPFGHIVPIPSKPVLFLLDTHMLSGEAVNDDFAFLGLTRPVLEPTIYHTGGEHANYYIGDAVMFLHVCVSSIKNGKSRETGNIGHVRRRKTKQKHNTIFVGHHYTHKQRK